MKNQRQLKKKRSTPRVRVQQKTAEVTAVGKLIRQLGELGGGALGTYLGSAPAGVAAGSSLGEAISKWLGFGDYTVGSNTILQKASTGIPMMHKGGQTVTIRHKEFIATVESSTTFKVLKSFKLNPGDKETFPWLSTIANSFQEYRFKGVVFHYIPTSGNAISGSSPSLGSVMMQTSYRAVDTAPANKIELLNEYWSGESVPSETFVHPIECNPAENPFNVQYVRRGVIPSSDNQLFYDLGVTNLCTQGQLASGNVLGDVWVTYEVELKKPIVASNVTSDAYDYGGYTATATGSQPFNGMTRTFGTLGVDYTNTSFQVTGHVGTTLLCMVAIEGTTIAGSWGSPVLTNCTVVDFNTQRPLYQFGSATKAVNVLALQPIDPGKPIIVNYPSVALTGTLTTSTLNIMQL